MKDDARNSPYGVNLLLGLQSKLIYQGTKGEGVAERRAKRKRAKAARELLEGGSDEDVEPDEKPYWLGAVLGAATPT